jgi:putative ABC transport system permease protein
MFDLEKAIIGWRRGQRRSPSIEDGDLAELEAHLRDEIDSLIDKGLSEEEAFNEAVRKNAGPGEVGAELLKAHRGRRTGGARPSSRWDMPALLLNYLKTTLRKMRKEKGYALINIIGLAAGMAGCILIFLWVQDELSYDRFHDKGERIFRVFTKDHSGGEIRLDEGAPSPVGSALTDEYPEITNFTRLQSGWTGWYLHQGERNFSAERLAAIESSFFEIFHFPFIEGNPKTALENPHSIVLTETLARKIYGDEQALGQVLQLNSTDMQVTGVIGDIPRNSHIQFDYAFPAVNMTQWRSSRLEDWTYLQFATYIELAPEADWRAADKKITGIVQRKKPDSKLEVYLCPLKNVHFELRNLGNFVTQYQVPGSRPTVYLFSVISALVLLLACVNFMNLATARSEHRAREVGIRKVLGAFRSDLIRQFIGESLAMSFISLVLALLLVWLLLPAFNVIAFKQMNLATLGQTRILIGLIGIVLITGLASGSYPALYLSAFRPGQVLRKAAGFLSRRGGILRRVLVVGQFTVTVLLITATAVIYSQLRYMQNADLGYDKDNIVYFASYGGFGRDIEATKNTLLQNPNILSVCKAFPPAQGLRLSDEVEWEGKEPGRTVLFTEDIGDYDFRKTFNFRMIQGRYYSREHPSDESSFVINESAVREMGLSDPLGKWFSYRGKKGPIIGIAEDFHGSSLHQSIMPKIISLTDEGFFLIVKFREGKTREVMSYLEAKWKENVPNRPSRISFLDELVRRSYEAERRIQTVFQIFAALSISIACLGLFGLVSFVAERRTKEIGIRKILGAGVPGIVRLITSEFFAWVLLSNLIAWPLSFFAARQWLNEFAYRIPLGIGIFLFSSALAVLLTVATVGYQSLRAALANPVDSLRYE